MTMLSTRILKRTSRAVIFTTSDMVRWMDAPQPEVSRALGELERRELLARVMQGVWANSKHPRFSPYRLVPFLAPATTANEVRGYVSVISALSYHGMISQIPAAVHVVVTRQRPSVLSAVGEFQFYQLHQALYDGFEPGDSHAYFHVATPTKAVFDTLYFSVRKGTRWRYLPEIELPRSVTDVAMQGWISRLQTDRLRVAVDARWQALRRQAKGS